MSSRRGLSVLLLRLIVYARILVVLAVVVIVLGRRRGMMVSLQVVEVASRHGRRHGNASTHRLEAPGRRRAVFDGTEFAGFVHVTVFAVHLARRILGLDLVRAVRVLITVGVRPVLVLSVHLFQYGNRLSCRCGQRSARVKHAQRLAKHGK